MALPEGYSLRKPQKNDLNHYINTLKGLTTVGDISELSFEKLLDHWESLSEVYHPRVIVNASDEVVATGMLLIEQKMIHACGSVGHIEDIAVAGSEQGKKLGYNMINELSTIAHQAGCYKVILDCSPDNVKFYEKCGYKNAGIEMQKRF